MSDKSERKITVALVDSANFIEDWLDDLGVSLNDLCDKMMGSWMFVTIEALKSSGLRAVMFCTTARVQKPLRLTHKPTGTIICFLPASRFSRFLGRFVVKLRARSLDLSENGLGQHWAKIYRLQAAVLSVITSYLSIPLLLLARELRSDDCTVILCQDYEHARFDLCVFLGRLMGIPVFGTFQGAYPQPRLVSLLRPLAMRACSGLIISVKSEIRRVRTSYRISYRNVAYILPPLNMAIWTALDRNEARLSLGIPLDADVVAWHGMVSISHKGLDTLMEAWQQVCLARPHRDLRLILLGTGYDADILQRRIRVLKLRGIHWLNKWVLDRSEILWHLSSADVYAFPSRDDGPAQSAMEAMACGLPIVATDFRGITDLLPDGEVCGGLIVPRENSTAFACALERLLDDKIERSRLGTLARQRAQTCFSIEGMGRELTSFLLMQSTWQQSSFRSLC